MVHKLTAVGSRDAQKAQTFIDANAPNVEGVKAHGDYASVYNDSVGALLNVPTVGSLMNVPRTLTRCISVRYNSCAYH